MSIANRLVGLPRTSASRYSQSPGLPSPSASTTHIGIPATSQVRPRMSIRYDRSRHLATVSETVSRKPPSVNQIIQDGREDLRIHKQRSKDCTLMWCRQAERIHILRDVYKFRGELLLRKGREIGFEKDDTHRLSRLYPRVPDLISICEEWEKTDPSFEWPGLQSALRIVEGKADRLYGKMGRATDQERETPDWLYRHYDNEFHFTCDACASDKNHKHPNYFTKEQDALTQYWQGVIWLNPPWNQIAAFIKKGYEAGQARATVVCLVPLWPTEPWFLQYAVHGHIRILSDRVAFVGFDQKAPQCLCVIIFTKGSRRRPDGSLYVTIEEIEAPKKPKGKDKTATVMSRGFAAT